VVRAASGLAQVTEVEVRDHVSGRAKKNVPERTPKVG